MQIFLLAADFVKINFFKKFVLSECQMLGLDPDQDRHYGMLFVILFSFIGSKLCWVRLYSEGLFELGGLAHYGFVFGSDSALVENTE